MSRNAPIGQAGARAPLRRHPAERDPYAAQPNGPTAGQWPPQQYADPPAQHGQQQQYPHQQGQGYYFPQGEPDANYGYAQQQPGTQPPPFNAYPAAPAPGYAAPHPHAGQPAWNQGHDPQEPHDLHGLDARAHDPRAHDPRDPRAHETGRYDLGSYMPTGAQGYAPPEQPPFQQQHDPAAFGAPHQGYGEGDGEYEEPLAEEEEGPRRGRRGLMIVAALVGAIGLGGALAYTYKTFIASSNGRAPLIKAADGQNKIKPATPGGKEFAHTDKKILNKLEDGGPMRVAGAPGSEPEAQDERANDDPNAPRKVRIIPITPGGQPPPVAASAPAGARPPMVPVPGVTLENLGPAPGGAPPSAQRVQLPPSAPPAATRTAQVAAPPARVTAAAALPPAAVEPAAPAKKVAALPKNPVPKAKEPAAAPAVTATSGAGFVAVLSSQKSRMDALKAFADLQQKYGDVLATRTPDVQEANLGEKGMWYRAVVGPPGSRDAAAGVCNQLKTAGYSGCWVTAY